MKKSEKKKLNSYDLGGTVAVALVTGLVLLIAAVIILQGSTVTFSGSIVALFIVVGIVYSLGGVVGFIVHRLWVTAVFLWRMILSLLRRGL